MSVYAIQLSIWLLILSPLSVDSSKVSSGLRLDPKLTTLGDHMFMPELLVQLSTIGGHHPAMLQPCDPDQEAIVAQCGIKDLLNIFFPDVLHLINGTNVRAEENLGVKIKPEALVREMCSAYSQFDRCLAGFGIRQTCVPRYLSTVDVMVGYSCGQGRSALICISNKMKPFAMAAAIGNTPGCDRAIPINMFMQTAETWMYMEKQYHGNTTLIPVQSVMAMVCVQWNFYNQCYLPGYAYLCGDVTKSYFSGLHQAVVAMVTKILTEMGPEYAKLSSCKQQTIRLEYIVLKVSLAIYRPKFAGWVNKFSMQMDEYAKQFGPCSGAAMLARVGYCVASGLKSMPNLPNYESVDTFPKLGTWFCEGTFKEMAVCYASNKGDCPLEKDIPFTGIATNMCKLQDILKQDPQIFCFAWDQILSDPMFDFFTPCNITMSSMLETAFYAIEHYKELTLCNKDLQKIVRERILLPSLCVLEKFKEGFKILTPHCGKTVVDIVITALQDFIQMEKSLAAMGIMKRKEICL